MKRIIPLTIVLLVALGVPGGPVLADSWWERYLDQALEGADSGRQRERPSRDKGSRHREGRDKGSRHREGRRNPPSRDRRGELSLDSAVDQVRGRTGGRILSADTVERDGQRMHEIKILTEGGRVRRFQIDPGSGEFKGRPPVRSYR